MCFTGLKLEGKDLIWEERGTKEGIVEGRFANCFIASVKVGTSSSSESSASESGESVGLEVEVEVDVEAPELRVSIC